MHPNSQTTYWTNQYTGRRGVIMMMMMVAVANTVMKTTIRVITLIATGVDLISSLSNTKA